MYTVKQSTLLPVIILLAVPSVAAAVQCTAHQLNVHRDWEAFI